MDTKKFRVWLRCLSVLALCIVVVSVAKVARAVEPAVTLTMDDLLQQPIDGLVHPSGVTFGFTVGGVGSEDALYNSGGPGQTTFVNDPSIEGSNSGVMRLDFDMPTQLLEFGVAISVQVAVDDAIVVSLFAPDDQGLVSSVVLDMVPSVSFAEAKFTYAGEPIQSAIIDFTPASSATERFAFDNLTFALIPEPSTLAMAVCACVGFYGRRRRRPMIACAD